MKYPHIALSVFLLCAGVSSGEVVTEWIELLPEQTAESAVVSLKDESITPPAVQDCAEIIFESNGCDFITESQFTIIVWAVINCEGKIERYRILRKPPVSVDFTVNISQALSKWRFKPAHTADKNIAVYEVLVFPKELMAVQTSACEKIVIDLKNKIF